MPPSCSRPSPAAIGRQLPLLLFLTLLLHVPIVTPCRHVTVSGDDQDGLLAGTAVLTPLRQALDVMQTRWFELWVGAWPTAIDWTGAVVNAVVVASLESFSELLFHPPHRHVEEDYDHWGIKNEFNLYFAQSAAYYFGENAFAIRNQAYDDMLWVVLGWLDAVKFVNSHSRRHNHHHHHNVSSALPWFGTQYTHAFAHRARIFYDLARRGWDETLCGGGMTWNPSLEPYKNAITNQLYITASVGMYLYFPGDCNSSPFSFSTEARTLGLQPAVPHEPQFRQAAVDAYEWLKHSNMTNDQGLYVDGFHVRGWGRNGSVGTGKCDERNEMVYTYNQGVILSGLRGLWESTGDRTYLVDAHRLIRNTLRATGWNLDTAKPLSVVWAGLGRDGILEDFCDHTGACNQDGQMFKGIYFHHLAFFCQPLPLEALVPGLTAVADKETALLHRQSCRRYAPWVARNAQAAMATRDDRGRFGGWWGVREEREERIRLPNGAIDYRNDHHHHSSSETERGRWRLPHVLLPSSGRNGRENHLPDFGNGGFQDALTSAPEEDALLSSSSPKSVVSKNAEDPNDRGRGRTLETHAAGVAVVRAFWEFLNKAA